MTAAEVKQRDAWQCLYHAVADLDALADVALKMTGHCSAGLNDPIYGVILSLRSAARQATEGIQGYLAARDAIEEAEEAARVERMREAPERNRKVRR